MLHGNELPLNQNLVYCLSPTAALEQSLKAIWDAVSQGAVLILAQIKLNSQLSSYTSFLSQHYSSLLAWKIPWMEEPGRLHSMGSWSRTRLSDFTFTFHFHALEKEMATHSSVLAWRIPGTGEPGGLPSMGSHRVGHDWSGLAVTAAAVNFPFHTCQLLLHICWGLCC